MGEGPGDGSARAGRTRWELRAGALMHALHLLKRKDLHFVKDFSLIILILKAELDSSRAQLNGGSHPQTLVPIRNQLVQHKTLPQGISIKTVRTDTAMPREEHGLGESHRFKYREGDICRI